MRYSPIDRCGNGCCRYPTIVTTLATQLVASYGRSFEARNLRRMMQFAEQFPDFGIVSPLATQK